MLLALNLFFLLACNASDSDKNSATASKDQTKASSDETAPVQKFRNIAGKKDITGVWANGEKELLSVKIGKDSIYYVDHFESYKYDLKKDSIYINYPEFVYSGRIGFRKDTLVMISIEGESKFFKIQN